jgi:hypothetical protein
VNNERRAAWIGGLCICMLTATSSAAVSSEKGGFGHADVQPVPSHPLDLAPLTQDVARDAATRCATPLAGQPLDMGDAAGFTEKLVGKVAGAAVGQLLSGFLGGGGKKQPPPQLYKDQIDAKAKTDFDDAATGTRLQLGGEQFKDGLLLSSRIDKSKGKSTYHAIFLELPDCQRIWPVRYLGYELWGEWSLSVSITKTTSSYSDGKLVNQSVEHSGWSDSGTFDYSRGISVVNYDAATHGVTLELDPNAVYVDELKKAIGAPVWQQLGYAEPTSGLRGLGAVFAVDPAALPSRTLAVVHVTHVDGGRYSTVGFPLRVSIDGGALHFQQLPSAISSN